MFLSNPNLNVLFQYLVRKAKGLEVTDLLKKDLYSALWNETFGLQQINLSGNKAAHVHGIVSELYLKGLSCNFLVEVSIRKKMNKNLCCYECLK